MFIKFLILISYDRPDVERHFKSKYLERSIENLENCDSGFHPNCEKGNRVKMEL